VGFGGNEFAAGLLLERCLDLLVVEEVCAVQVDLDEGLHRNAEKSPVLAAEVVCEGGEVGLVVIRGLELGLGLERIGDVHQEVTRKVGVDNVLLDIDHIIDAGAGLHVLDGLVIHLVPGRRLDVDADAGQFFELRSQNVGDKVRWRCGLSHAADRHSLELLTGVLPPVGVFDLKVLCEGGACRKSDRQR
jgi:hypothetical protein